MREAPELPFGQYGQVDFGEYWMEREDGGRLKVYFFVMILSRSRYKYVCFSSRPFNTASTVYAHELAFSYYGGRPGKLLYDQDKVPAARRESGRPDPDRKDSGPFVESAAF